MDFILYYFSGTGNTKLISREIKARLENKKSTEVKDQKVELISIEDLKAASEIDIKSTVIGIGFPVHKFTYPRIFQQLFRYLERIRKEQQISLDVRIPAFIFCTYARFPANSLNDLNKKLHKIGFDIIHSRAFKAPSNGIFSLKESTDYEFQSVMFFERHIDKKIEDFVNNIIVNVNRYRDSPFSLRRKIAPLEKLKLTIVESIENTKYPILQIDDSCVKCGACVKECPDHNLVKEENYIRILDPVDCLHCLRCLHHCPTKSISFGPLTVGPKRYTPNVVRNLYRDSINGRNPKFEENLSAIVKIWRKYTLKYWKQHREPHWWIKTRQRMKSRLIE